MTDLPVEFQDNQLIPLASFDIDSIEDKYPEITEEQRNSVLKDIKRDEAVPIGQVWKTCPGARLCELRCPLAKANLPQPLGQACPIEMEQAKQWFLDLVKELNILHTDLTDISIVREIIKLQLWIQRIEALFAESNFVIHEPGAFNPCTGEVYELQKEHKGFSMYIKLKKRLDYHRKELIATRLEKNKKKQVLDPQKFIELTLDKARKKMDKEIVFGNSSPTDKLFSENKKDQQDRVKRLKKEIGETNIAVEQKDAK